MGLSVSREYARELRDLQSRIRKYREMRSDPAVDTALKAGEKPILGAQWTITTEADGGANQEIRDFLEDNLYPVLDDLLRWLLGAWQFGFATVEPVFRFREEASPVFVSRGRTRRMRRGQSGRIWIHRLVHLLPESVEGFAPDAETGELGFVRQAVYVEGRGFLRPEVPGWKVLHAVHDREGDDFSGRAMLRSMFMPWDIKLSLLRSFVVHWDRFGTGTPHMQAGETWRDDDYERAEKYLKAFRAGTEGFLITPFGGELAIFAGEEVTKSGPIEMIRYLDSAIHKITLSQILELGSSESGNRALGDSFLDLLQAALQSQAEYLAALIQRRVIVPLVDTNWGPQDEYPLLQPSVVLGKFTELVTTLSSAKTAGLLGWTAEDEARLRDMAELPEIDIEARQREMDEAAKAAQQAAAGGTGEEDGEPPARGKKSLSRTLAHSPDLQPPDTRPTPAMVILERDVLQARLLADRLDSQVFRAGSEVDEVLRDVTEALVEQAAGLADEGFAVAAREAATRIRTPAVLRRRLEAAVRTVAERAQALGRQSVEEEGRRQQELGLAFTEGEFLAGPADAPASGAVGRGLRDPGPVSLLLQSRFEDAGGFMSLVEGEVQREVVMELDRRENAARGALLRALQEGGGHPSLVLAVRRRVRAELEALSPAVTRLGLEGVINVAVGVGRHETARQLMDRGEIAFGVRSEVMDGNTCVPCRAGDGRTFTTLQLRNMMAPPFPDCEGRGLCRGVIVYVRSTERPATR